jgi:UDP-2,3-diacylglucosamine pyrophosphatase LpxH
MKKEKMTNKDFKIYKDVYESGFLGLDENGILRNNKDSNLINKFPSFDDYYGEPIYHFENIIISDIHLGSKLSQTEMLITFLKNISFDRLIINGDVFDSINMKRLSRHHWKVLSVLRKITDKDKGKEVIWIRGNHDGFSDLLTQLLGIKVYNEFMFKWNDKNVLALHGDVFDVYTSKHPILSEVADIIYKFAISIDPVKNRISKFLKKNTKAFLRNTQIVRERSLAYGKNKKADIVCCGHTHHPEKVVEDKMVYLNSGSWTTHPTSFIGFAKYKVEIVPFTHNDVLNIHSSKISDEQLANEVEFLEETNDTMLKELY